MTEPISSAWSYIYAAYGLGFLIFAGCLIFLIKHRYRLRLFEQALDRA